MLATFVKEAGLRSAFVSVLVLVACSTEGDIIRTRDPEPIRVHTPRSADDFVDSLGVSVPIVQRDISFDGIILPAVRDLGIRHVRDFAPLPGEATVQSVQELAALQSAGARTQLVFETRFGLLPEHVVPLWTELGGALEAIEGPNDFDALERDLSANEVRDAMHGLREAIDGAGLTDEVALVHALDLTAEPVGDLAAILDYGNFERPRTAGLPAPSLAAEKETARAIAGSRPLMVTECGYTTLTDVDTGVPEAVAAKYVPRLILGHFAEGIARTFFADLTDTPEMPEAPRDFEWEGLVRIDGTHKPSFDSVARLIALLSDPGEPFTLAPLEYRLVPRPAALRELLLGKRDGTFILIVWLEVPSYDPARKTEIAVEPEAIQLELAAPAAEVTLYRPVQQAEPFSTEGDVDRITLDVADEPLIVVIAPAP